MNIIFLIIAFNLGILAHAAWKEGWFFYIFFSLIFVFVFCVILLDNARIWITNPFKKHKEKITWMLYDPPREGLYD